MKSMIRRKSTYCAYLANLPMVPSGSLREEDLVVGQLLLVRERDAIDALQRLLRGVPKEI